MTKKRRNSLEVLRDALLESKDDGIYDNPSQSLLNKTSIRIRAVLKKVFKIELNKTSKFFSSNFRKAYLITKKPSNILSRNVGLKAYTLESLNEDFKKTYKTMLSHNLGLIKTQNAENMLKLENRFVNWVTSKSVDDKKDLKNLVKLPNNKRIKFILKDQTNKLTSNFDEIVATKYGAIAMQWKTRSDNRVVGKPGGLYPGKGSTKHRDHWSRKDKFYYYPSNPVNKSLNLSKFEGSVDTLKDGLPGQPIGCRCYARYYYDLDDLPKELVK